MFSRVASAKSSLHFNLVYFRQPQSQAIEENLLVVGGLGEATFADVDAATSWQNHVDHSEFAQLVQNSTWLAAKPRSIAHLAKRLPQHVRQEADEDVGLDAVLFLMPDRSDAERSLL